MPTARYSLDERRAIFDEGVPIILPSGVEVHLRPITPEALLRAGKIPDTVTPIVTKALYEPDKTQAALDEFIKEERQTPEETLTMLTTISVVCEAAMVDPSLMPYLSFQDKGFIFRIAFLPAEVLSRFRARSLGDVERVDDGDQVQPVARRDSGRGSRTQQPSALPA
jgi:hypothetical protein